MIAYLEGRVAEQTDNSCILVTSGGVGYEVFLPAHTLMSLPEQGQTVFFYIATIVREDALELFGFSTWDERTTFLTLIAINRVGPRTATGILSVFRPDDLRRIVQEEDVLQLTKVSGIGKKTAQQVFLELKYKLRMDDAKHMAGVVGTRGSSTLQDAVAGLLNLGYQEDESVQMVRKVLADEPDLDVGGALRAALKLLAKGR